MPFSLAATQLVLLCTLSLSSARNFLNEESAVLLTGAKFVPSFCPSLYNRLPNNDIFPGTALNGRDMETDDSASRSALEKTGGSVHYLTPLNPEEEEESGHESRVRNTGMSVKFTYCSLNPPGTLKGRKAYNKNYPPGWEEVGDARRGSRAHLLGRSLGGDGRYFRNIVAFFHEANLNMNGFECKIGEAFDNLRLTKDDVVYYTVMPHYTNDEEQLSPDRMILFANVKLSHKTSGSVEEIYVPWISAYIYNGPKETLQFKFDNSESIIRMKDTLEGTTPTFRTCVPRASSPVYSLDFFPTMDWSASSWILDQSEDSPTALLRNGRLLFNGRPQSGSNKRVNIRSRNDLWASNGVSVQFRLLFSGTTSSEMKLALGGGIILRWTDQGKSAYWVTYDGTFIPIAKSRMSGEGTWTDILIIYKPDKISLYEWGEKIFEIRQDVGHWLSMTFNFQSLDVDSGAPLSVSNVLVQEHLYE